MPETNSPIPSASSENRLPENKYRVDISHIIVAICTVVTSLAGYYQAQRQGWINSPVPPMEHIATIYDSLPTPVDKQMQQDIEKLKVRSMADSLAFVYITQNINDAKEILRHIDSRMRQIKPSCLIAYNQKSDD